jgi:MtfA peptidase
MSCLGSVASHGRHGAADRSEGKNLVLHEFAHQLDFEDFAADGVPALASRSDKLS